MFSKMMKYVWPEIRKHKRILYIILCTFSIRTIVDSIIRPIYFKKIIDVLSSENLNRTAATHDVLKLVFIIIALNIFVLLIARVGKFLYFAFEINVISELRTFAFQKLETHSQTFFANTFAGSLVTKSRRFVNAFESMFDILMYSFLPFFIILVGVFVVLIEQAPLISAIFTIWVIVHITVVSLFVKHKIQYDQLEAEQDSKISGRLADVFGNIMAVKFFSARKREVESFGEYVEEGVQRSRKAWFLGARIDILQGTFICIVQSIFLYVMVQLWLKNEMSTGTIVLIQTYMVILYDRLWGFGNDLTRFMKLSSDMKEMIDIFEQTPDILDPKKPEILKIKDGHIIFHDVNFKYTLGAEILNNFNLDIKPGERVGIVGHSGAGKSTITKLLLRFTDIASGSITIDDQDIRNIAQDDLRSTISYVPQEPVLFHRTIRENISYGKPDATDAEIFAVAEKAHASDFIENLVHKYDTLVGERGVKLSGGERQRVAIARAMLKDSPILILDEATSSLDSMSEKYIQEALQILMKGKTTIVIAHRLSTIQKMDRIIVLDKGAIAEEGTHAQLLKKKGIYHELWSHQTDGFIE